MIAVAMIVAVGLLAVAGLVLMLARSASLDYQRTRARLDRPDRHTLVYSLPEGQDAAAVVVDLARAGFPAVEEDAHSQHVVRIWSHGDRAGVRSVLATTVRRPAADVVFADEELHQAMRHDDDVA